MTKKRSTKRALLLSFLSLLMCVSMLIGSTYAWFTDSVTSANNKIQSGTLKIDLELLNAETGAWDSLKANNDPIFNYDKWEPGYTDVKVLRVSNKGNLALKWIAKFVSAGELSDLAEVIDVYVKEDVTSYPDKRVDLSGWKHVGNIQKFVDTIETTTHGELEPMGEAGAIETLGIALKMQETAGNYYQGMSLGAFDIQIFATQLTYEDDSFDDQYDVESKYPMVSAPVALPEAAAAVTLKTDFFTITVPAPVVEDIKDDGAKKLHIEHTAPVFDKVNNTVSFDSVELVDENGNVVDIPENNPDLLEIVLPVNYPDGATVNVYHDGVQMATGLVVANGCVTYTVEHLCEVTVELVTEAWDGKTEDTTWYDAAEDEFELYAPEQIAGLASLVDGGKSFKGKTISLVASVDLGVMDENGEPISFEPIGSFSDNKAFDGVFDGQGHTIFNMYQSGWALSNGYWDGPEYGMGFFSLVENASVKNVNFDGASLPTEANIIGVVAGGAANSTFENINITNAYLGNHSWYSGGAIGWAEGEVKLINCDIDANSVVSSQWGDFNNANGGLIGGIDSTSKIYLKDCEVACVIDAYNDVTSAYEWYSYRSCGMLIGDTEQKDDPDGDNVGNAIAPNLTCENVTVIYGDWANYHYCEFGSADYPICRVEPGESTGAYGNARVGEYTDANGNQVVDDSHVHNDGEKHNELIVFDQLYGGTTGDRYCTYGAATHEGVTVIYNNK